MAMTECREFRGARTAGGYGERRVGGKVTYVHRWVWEQVHGPLAPGEVVRHSCDNPPCFLLAHLRVGTQVDNLADMMERGRNRNQNTGRTHCKRGHELTPENVYVHPKDGVRECIACRELRRHR